jgi:hypothetical protein
MGNIQNSGLILWAMESCRQSRLYPPRWPRGPPLLPGANLQLQLGGAEGARAQNNAEGDSAENEAENASVARVAESPRAVQ